LKLKLDENLGESVRVLFTSAGHDTSTVARERICGASDLDLIRICKQEGRALITLDLDFANPLLFRPSEHHGIAVLRSPGPMTPRGLQTLCQTMLHAVRYETLRGRLWIVEPGRIRIYQEPHN
jgi:predicted nuclease of predicted toxin-antitoxin system